MRPPLHKTPDDIGLHTAIHQNYFFSVSLAVFHHLTATGLAHQIFPIGVIKVDVVTAFNNDFTQHRTFLAQNLGQSACIDAANTNHALFLEPVAQAVSSLPVTVIPGVVLANDGFGVNFLAFKKFTHSINYRASRNAIIANERIG